MRRRVATKRKRPLVSVFFCWWPWGGRINRNFLGNIFAFSISYKLDKDRPVGKVDISSVPSFCFERKTHHPQNTPGWSKSKFTKHVIPRNTVNIITEKHKKMSRRSYDRFCCLTRVGWLDTPKCSAQRVWAWAVGRQHRQTTCQGKWFLRTELLDLAAEKWGDLRCGSLKWNLSEHSPKNTEQRFLFLKTTHSCRPKQEHPDHASLNLLVLHTFPLTFGTYVFPWRSFTYSGDVYIYHAFAAAAAPIWGLSTSHGITSKL